MLTSGTGRHRRARRRHTPRLAATAGIAGAGLMLPLLSASGASAAPGFPTHASHAGWQEHRQHRHQSDSDGQHRHQADPTAARPSAPASPEASQASSSPSPSAPASHAPESATARPGGESQGSHSARPSAPAPAPASHTSAPSSPSSPSAPATHAPAPAPAPAPAATPTTPATQTASSSDAVRQVLNLINQARAAQGLPAYTITSGLTSSAETHDQTMADGCGMSHQCPGEAELGARETAAGVQWNADGENIGYGNGVSTSAQDIAAMAVSLTQDMLNETPPDDGHRKNILSSEFTHIGIAVHRDAGGTVWLTQDFSN
ncbi:CAP domain-containing protein [Kitasatospora sp. NPDC004669]|uniref:CAP domain-containing protein n=1 Tax=Kitasatospora sp. NPDC004669 TaxID=3154555 RepID=UPI0033BB1D96